MPCPPTFLSLGFVFGEVSKIKAGFLGRFGDPIRVPRNSNRVPRIRENYHQVPRIREIGSLQIYTGYLTFSLKKRTLIKVMLVTFLCEELSNVRR